MASRSRALYVNGENKGNFMTNRLTKLLLAGASPAMLLALAAPALAQSTGTQEMQQIESVVVTGENAAFHNGLMNAAPLSKERSTVDSQFLQTQAAGQTVFESLNFMPGVNFTNNDPYGSSGGDIRVHGQDGNHISLTLDGMPLNDTGNYAIYTNQMIDPEVIDRVSANQGSTDVDSPTAAATGGVIAIVSDKPHDTVGAEAVLSGGSYSDQRYFGRVDTGEFGPLNTKAFFTLSYQDYDKFKGPGEERKIQGNFKFEQDFGDTGWITFAGHWNTNRNNSYYGLDYAPNVDGATANIQHTVNVIKNPHGSGYISNPLFQSTASGFSGSGLNTDYQASCIYNQTGYGNDAPITAAPVAGVADDTMTTCGNWYKVKINPSDTGNLRMQSLWHITDALTVTADANVQYVLANGGGLYSFYEDSPQLIGATQGGVSTGTTTTPYGCLAGKGCDLNGDGDVLDEVGLYQPSTTNTRRWGFSTSVLYQFDTDNTVQLAYTLDYGLHRQTGTTSFVDPTYGPYDPFAGLRDKTHEVLDATGEPLRYRDRKSKAIMNQAAFDYEGKFFDNMLQTSLGFRLPFLERDLNNYCYTKAGSSTAYCTTQTPSVTNSDGTVSFAGDTAHYAPPGHAVRRYNRFLPHLGVTLLPFGDDHQFFATYTQEIAAPRTDNLYQSTCTDYTTSCQHYSNFTNTRPETSTTYQLGYRFLGEDLQSSLVLWNSQIKNRIVSSYDQDTNTYYDHNVKGLNFWGVDFESNYNVLDNVTLYANAGYDRARITSNIQVQQLSGSPVLANTYNKQLEETPKWTLTGRAEYRPLENVRLGVSVKYVGKRYESEDNNAWVPDYYTVNLDATYDLDNMGLEEYGLQNSSIRVDAINLFNKGYFSSIAGPQTCWVPNGSVPGCTSIPYAYVGAPRTVQVTLTARY